MLWDLRDPDSREGETKGMRRQKQASEQNGSAGVVDE